MQEYDKQQGTFHARKSGRKIAHSENQNVVNLVCVQARGGCGKGGGPAVLRHPGAEHSQGPGVPGREGTSVYSTSLVFWHLKRVEFLSEVISVQNFWKCLEQYGDFLGS
jgi:hypothetical protein